MGGSTKNMVKFFFLFIPILLLTSTPAKAFELWKLRVNGFIAQGYIKSTDNNYLSHESTEGLILPQKSGVVFKLQLDYKRISFKKIPVCDSWQRATCSGVP